VEAACLETHVNAACAAATGLPAATLAASFARLPGSTSFISEQSSTAASEREELAIQLAEYLASGKHDSVHIRQLVHHALDSAADAAHREAMARLNRPLAAAPATPLPREENASSWSADKHIVAAPAAASGNALAATPTRPAQPVIDPNRQTAMQLRQLQREQQSMQELMGRMQKDLQRVAEDLSQLHVESRLQHRPHSVAAVREGLPVASSQWRSTPDPAGSPFNHTHQESTAQLDYIDLLRQEVDLLQRQLLRMRARESAGLTAPPVEQADFEQSDVPSSSRLRPRHAPSMALTPAASTTPVTVNYYVGDLMQPPFHTATLQLIRFLKANVDPDSWTNSHMMQITEPAISLAITQMRDNHEQIAELLRQIRIGARSYHSSEDGTR
jgi:hypothetical protein